MAWDIPKSVRQIGQIHGTRRIYVEDYVISFSRQLAKDAGEKEVAGVLLGNSYMRKGEKFIFISGMVTIPNFELREDDTFSQEMWTDIYTEMKEHFTDVEVLGWYYAKAEMPLTCTEQLRGIHGKNFAGGDKLLYLFEEGENEDVFFLYSSGTLEQQQGYYIYYEKNHEMQEYMVSHKQHDSIDEQLVEPAMQTMRGILEQKQEVREKQSARNSYGVAVALGLLALILGGVALRNQNALSKVESQVNALKETMGMNATMVTDPAKTTVETLESTLATITPAAVVVTPAAVTEVPSEASVATPPAIETPIVIAKKYDLYVVEKGDTLSGIAAKYYSDSTKATKIQRYNHLKEDAVIMVGQKLKLPIN